MRCTACGSEIADQAGHCRQCGAIAPRACPACKTVVAASAKFCPDCGTRIDAHAEADSASSHALAGEAGRDTQPELRQTTILVCDLADSTAFTSSLDPEDSRDLLRGFLDSTAEVVRAHRGYVARYMGDGLLAYFGYPQAQEDDAERAVRAGLEMVAVVHALRPVQGIRLQLRVGIATGVVVAGDMLGEGASREAAVTGATPGLAARLQGAAAPGSVVISATTRKLVGNLFECVDLGLLELKGFSAPVNAWRIAGERLVESRFEALHPTGSLTPLVGRDLELETLLQRWQLARGGAGQAVIVKGEPGIGKSRLLRAMLDDVGKGPCTVLRYYCAQRFQNTALHPIIGQIERDAGFDRDDTAEQRLHRLEALVSRAMPRDQLASTVPYIATLLSIPIAARYRAPLETPERQKERLFAALKAQPAALAKAQPVLIVFEDLHWADPTTLELIAQFVEEMKGLAVMLVASARPECELAWSTAPHSTVLDLQRLTHLSSASIVSFLTAGKPLPTQLLEEILSRSDGVPLFVEELTKTVLESGVLAERQDHFALSGAPQTRAVPSTLHDSLMARLDRLSTVKEVAQVGAAIGRDFPHELLAALLPMPAPELESVLARLVEADLIRVHGTPPRAVYSFKHALIHDAAYASMVRDRRHKLHTQIAQALETHAAAGAAAQPEVLAHHWSSAGQAAKAVPHWQQAGINASARVAHTEAIHHFLAALGPLREPSLHDFPEESTRHQLELGLQVRLGLSLSAVRGYAAPEVEAAYQRARELCHLLGDVAELFPVIRGLCTFYIVRDELDTAKPLAEQCVRLGEETGRKDYQIEGCTALGYIVFYHGHLGEATELLQRAVDIYRRSDGEKMSYPSAQDPCVASLCLLAHALCLQGKLAAARRTAEQVTDLVKRLGSPAFEEAYSQGYLAMFETLMGNPEGAIQHAQRTIAVSQQHGFTVWHGVGHVQLACALAAMGEASTAIGILNAAANAFLASGAELSTPFIQAWIARTQRALGHAEQAADAIEAGLAFSARKGERYMDADLLLLRGALQASQADRAGARASLTRALTIARQQGARLFELRAAVAMHEIETEPADLVQARARVRGILDAIEQSGESPDVAKAQALVAP